MFPASNDLPELFGLASTRNEEEESRLFPACTSSSTFPEDLRLANVFGNFMGIEPVLGETDD